MPPSHNLFKTACMTALALIAAMAWTPPAPAADAPARAETEANDAPAPQQPEFVYNRLKRRDPFKSFLHLEGDEGSGGGQKLPTRVKEPLEEFELDSLTLVGTMILAGERKAMVQDPLGKGHSLTVGGYMGKHDGKIIAIRPGVVELVEHYFIPFKGLEQRKAVLQMKSEKSP